MPDRLADLLAVMRDETRPDAERTAAAIEALPLAHAPLPTLILRGSHARAPGFVRP